MKIITISRQFGSGGRELGKKLAAQLGWDYYDKNIITKLCENENLDRDYVKRVMSENEWETIPTTMKNSYAQLGINSGWQISLLTRQREIIEDIAKAGRDCIIVGRDADIILEEYRPFRIFVTADLDFRLNRCLEREEKNEGDKLDEKAILKNIRRIDRNRVKTREILTGKSVNDPSSFDLTVNTSSWDFDILVKSLANLSEEWFLQCTKTEI